MEQKQLILCTYFWSVAGIFGCNVGSVFKEACPLIKRLALSY